MKNLHDKLIMATVCGLLGVLGAGGVAQADPSPYSKAVTFTPSTPNPAAPSRSRYYLPANTKYPNVKLERASNQVAMESIQLAHEGFLPTSRSPRRISR